MNWGPTVKRQSLLFTVIGMIGLMFCNVANGSGLETFDNQTVIEGNAVSDFQGLIGINMASGDNHDQVNLHLIGVGNTPQVGVIDQVTQGGGMVPGKSLDLIGEYAFQSALGIVSINQAAGSGTAEANLVRIGYGVTVPLDTTALQQVVGSASQEFNRENGGGIRSDIIGEHAFENSRGIFQVNQSAGVANAVSNNLVINVNMQ